MPPPVEPFSAPFRPTGIATRKHGENQCHAKSSSLSQLPSSSQRAASFQNLLTPAVSAAVTLAVSAAASAAVASPASAPADLVGAISVAVTSVMVAATVVAGSSRSSTPAGGGTVAGGGPRDPRPPRHPFPPIVWHGHHHPHGHWVFRGGEWIVVDDVAV